MTSGRHDGALGGDVKGEAVASVTWRSGVARAGGGVRVMLAAACAASIGGCGGVAPPMAKEPIGAGSMRFESMRWLPPVGDTVFSYRTENVVEKTTGVMTLRLRRRGDDRAVLVGPRRSEELRYQADGIYREGAGAFLLRTPATAGLTWPGGPGASMRVAKVGVAAKVAAGAFERCIEVVDARSGPVRGEIVTTYCPDVGMVLIETRGAGPGGEEIHERVELTGYGEAIDLGAK